MLISVVLPYRDAAETIEEALASVLAQRDVELEVLAIDDGSRDDGPARIAALEDPRVRMLSSGGNGLVAALERGRREARGPLLARMDADDVCAPTRLAAQRDALLAMPEVAALGARVEVCGGGAGLATYVAWQNALVTPADHARELFVESPLCHPSVMLRRDVLDAMGGWRDVSWAEDYDLWLRLDAAGHGLAKLPAVLLTWRHSEGRATFADPRYGLDRFRAARAAFLAPKLLARGRAVAIWGAGPTGTRLARALEPHGVRAARFIDIDPKKIGKTRRGAPVVAPEALDPREQIVVAVGARGARALVREALVARGLVEGDDFVCAA